MNRLWYRQVQGPTRPVETCLFIVLLCAFGVILCHVLIFLKKKKWCNILYKYLLLIDTIISVCM